MTDRIPASKEALNEALSLSETILENLELGQLSLVSIALKACRLARLLNDFGFQKAFEFEASGYPSGPSGVDTETWRIGKLAGRVYQDKVTTNKEEEIKEYCYVESIEQLEEVVDTGKTALSVAQDPNISLASANPNQWIQNPHGNAQERANIRIGLSRNVSRISSRRSFIHKYVSRKYTELKFSEIPEDIFSRLREDIDDKIGSIVPTSTQKFAAIYGNLRSENPEDWSNAVHSCRRLLQDLADALYAPKESATKNVNGRTIEINLGADQFINRLIAFIEEKSSSKNFHSIVGSSLEFIGNRLDAIFGAAQKGSHAIIQDRQEADRYVIYTYLIVGDIISLT